TGEYTLVADAGQRVRRETVVGEFCFLQRQRVDGIVLQPRQHMLEADVQRVQIPGGDVHGRCCVPVGPWIIRANSAVSKTTDVATYRMQTKGGCAMHSATLAGRCTTASENGCAAALRV